MRRPSFVLAVVIVLGSGLASLLLKQLGMHYGSGIALVTWYPGLYPVLAALGGFHGANGEMWVLPIAGILSIIAWWLIIVIAHLLLLLLKRAERHDNPMDRTPGRGPW